MWPPKSRDCCKNQKRKERKKRDREEEDEDDLRRNESWGESSDSISIDMDRLGGKECLVETSKGSISVFICGDQEKPGLITYPDVALNYMSCFQGLFCCPDGTSLLLSNFCIYHIDAPGHESGAAAISSNAPFLSMEDLVDQVAEVLDFFGLKVVLCLGVTAGAYILTLFAMKYKERVLGLMLVSPLCRSPSWTERLYNKVMVNLLYFYGMCAILKECLLQRYFSKRFRSGMHDAEYDVVEASRRFLDERQSLNVLRFLQATNKRRDLTADLKKLQCKTLILVGENRPFLSEALHMSAEMDKRNCAFIEVQACGSLLTEEHPCAMLIPVLLNGFRLLPTPTSWLKSPRFKFCQPIKPVQLLHFTTASVPRELRC